MFQGKNMGGEVAYGAGMEDDQKWVAHQPKFP
jgi:hypothetical protein